MSSLFIDSGLICVGVWREPSKSLRDVIPKANTEAGSPISPLGFAGCASLLTHLPSCHRSQKFEDPAEGEPALVDKYKKLNEALTQAFRNLEDDYR